jgi:anti-anti-sigma factor
MEVTMLAVSTSRVFRADPLSLGRPEVHHRARFAVDHFDGAMRIAVTGEIDASNSRALADYVERQSAGAPRLILDLGGLDFFGTQGFAALHNVNVTCSRYGTSWVLVAGAQVRRLLWICDPDAGIVVTDGLAAALMLLDDRPALRVLAPPL